MSASPASGDRPAGEQACPCRRVECRRHGDCPACLAHNAKKGKTPSCIRRGGRPVQAVPAPPGPDAAFFWAETGDS